MTATQWLLAMAGATLIVSVLLLVSSIRQGRHARRTADNVDKVTPGEDG